MKILVISDTHGYIDRAEQAIRRHKDIEAVIHLGDYFRDAQKLSDIFPEITFDYIYGNSDFMIGDTPSEKLLEFCGKRVFITHGHRYSVKWGCSKLYTKAREMNAQLLMFGHTHIPELVKMDGFYILNPGSISDPRGSSRESYAVVEINHSKIIPEILHV